MTKSPAEQRRVDPANPEPGYYLVALVKGGWEVGAHIYTDDDYVHVVLDGCELSEEWRRDDLDQQYVDATIAGEALAHPLFRIVLFGKRCDELTYRHAIALKLWAIQHCPEHPCLWPNKPYTPNHLPALDF